VFGRGGEGKSSTWSPPGVPFEVVPASTAASAASLMRGSR